MGATVPIFCGMHEGMRTTTIYLLAHIPEHRVYGNIQLSGSKQKTAGPLISQGPRTIREEHCDILGTLCAVLKVLNRNHQQQGLYAKRLCIVAHEDRHETSYTGEIWQLRLAPLQS